MEKDKGWRCHMNDSRMNCWIVRGVFERFGSVADFVRDIDGQMVAGVVAIVPGIAVMVMKQYDAQLHHEQKYRQDE